MYPVSDAFLMAVRSNTRKYFWKGTIVTRGGMTYEFGAKEIVKGSGYISRQYCGSTEIELGTVYAAEMGITLLSDIGSDKAIIDMDKVEYYISICIQLFNLHCFIIGNDVTKSIEFDYINEDEIEQYFKQACIRLGYDCFTDEADENFWNEYRRIGGMDIMLPSLTFSHDFDEFGTYDSDVYEAM